MRQAHNHFRSAFVSGASSGIGEALCELLANQKIDLIIAGRDDKKLHSLAERWRQKVDVEVVVCDLKTVEGRKKVISVIQEHGPDLVINNAGYGRYGDALNYTVEEELDILTVNGDAVLEITLEAAHALRHLKKKGTIVNVSSVASFVVFPGSAVYAASKSFVTQVSEALDIEMQRHGIRVLASCPGVVETDFSRRAGALTATSPFRMQPEEAARHIWYQIQQGKSCYVFDWKNRFFLMLARFLPSQVIGRFLYKQIKSKI